MKCIRISTNKSMFDPVVLEITCDIFINKVTVFPLKSNFLAIKYPQENQGIVLPYLWMRENKPKMLQGPVVGHVYMMCINP